MPLFFAITALGVRELFVAFSQRQKKPTEQ
jgi:hypothetical protein